MPASPRYAVFMSLPRALTRAAQVIWSERIRRLADPVTWMMSSACFAAAPRISAPRGPATATPDRLRNGDVTARAPPRAWRRQVVWLARDVRGGCPGTARDRIADESWKGSHAPTHRQHPGGAGHRLG